MSTDMRLMAHQVEGVRLMSVDEPGKKVGRKRGCALLADDPGLGKTAQAIYWFFHKCPKPWRQEKLLVVCPATVKYNWQREVKDWTGIDAAVLEGKKPRAATRHLTARHRVVILNYDILHGWLDNLSKHHFGLVVFDEAQALQTKDSIRTRAAKRVSVTIPHRIATTGTPIANRPIDLWPILNILRPDLWPSFTAYARRYARVERTIWGVKFVGARNLDKLHRKLKRTVLIRRRKEDVLSLPPKTRHVSPIDLGDGWAEYRAAEQDFVRWLRATRPDRADKARKGERLARLTYMRSLIGRLKRPGVERWIEDFFANKPRAKLIVLGVHVEDMTKALYDKYRRPFGAVLVNGSVTGRKREEMILRFQQDDDCRLLVGNIRAAGAGWNGTQAADIAKAELDWTPTAHAQGEGRIDRIGQVLDSRVHYLITPKTIEDKLMRVLQEKQAIIDQAIDGGRKEAAGGFDIFDRLEDLILQESSDELRVRPAEAGPAPAGGRDSNQPV